MADESSGDPLHESWLIQEEASGMGFDWPDVSGVFDKVHEELREIQEALAAGDAVHARRELGDVLFAVVNLGRFLGASPSGELHRTNVRFSRRFSLLREEMARDGRIMNECTLAELDEVWDRVKKRLAKEESACDPDER